MFGKHSLFFILVIAALVGPAIYFNASWSDFRSVNEAGLNTGNLASIPVRSPSSFDLSRQGLSNRVSTIQVASPTGQNAINPSRTNVVQSPPAAPFVGNVILPGNANGPDFNAVPLEFMPVTNLTEIFRFDANPSWIRQRWSRVSATAGEQGLSGLRVALVTGVNSQDLFGSLTYYFDNNQVPQKITFRGWTGDPVNLINLVTQKFSFAKQPTSSAGLYVAKSWRKTTGALYLQHPNVVRAENPTQQMAILLEVNNPNGPYELTHEVSSMIFNKLH